MSNDYAFPFVETPVSRTLPKKRTSGLTMVADWGSSNAHLEDTLELVGPYVDFAKIVTGTSRLYKRDYLMRRLAIYQAYQVEPFIGGQFFEYMLALHGWGSIPRFFGEARALGFTTIEISENCIPMTSEERVKAIALARSHDLAVMGEVGSKDTSSEVADILASVNEIKDLDVEYLLLEAAEIFENGEIRRDLIDGILANVELDRIMIELPGPWISGVSSYMIHDLRKLLIKEFGPDVNLANVHFEEVIATEALRCGLGVVGPSRRNK